MTRARFLRRALPLSLTALIAGVWLAQAGDLSPPAGPVLPTFKTLTEVEPRIAINATNTPGDADALFKITQPGSYYLTGNVTGVVGKHGIEIIASGVTLDLNGFDLLGVAGSFDGVSVTLAGLTNIAVVTGSVRSWGGDGVDLVTFGATNCRVADLLASGNNGFGIRTGNGCMVLNCSAYNNTGTGIGAGGGCTVSNCTAYFNTGIGISTGNGSTVADCVARLNTLDGIACSQHCVIRGNSCSFNGVGGDGAGIHATSNQNRIEGNTCTNASRGIDVELSGNFIIKNTCAGNTTNWDVVAGNVCLVVQGVTGAAILGDTGGVAPGSTDPSANFTY